MRERPGTEEEEKLEVALDLRLGDVVLDDDQPAHPARLLTDAPQASHELVDELRWAQADFVRHF